VVFGYQRFFVPFPSIGVNQSAPKCGEPRAEPIFVQPRNLQKPLPDYP